MKKLLMFENGSGRKTTVRRRGARKRSKKGGSPMAARKRRRSAARKRPSRAVSFPRRRRAVRRNPTGFSPRNLVGQLVTGAKDGVGGVVGLAGVRLVRDKLGFTSGTLMGSGVELLASIGLGMVAARFLGAPMARAVVQGGFMSPIMGLVRTANVPLISSALGDDSDLGLYFPGYGYNPGALAAYPGGGDLQGYPTAPSLGDYDEPGYGMTADQAW